MGKVLLVLAFTPFLAGLHPAGSDEFSPPVPVAGSGLAYYVSAGGDDDLSGTSPGTAWESLEPLERVRLLPGDSVLFERGGEFRFPLNPTSGKAEGWVLYGAYGEGSRPILNGSLVLIGDSDWERVDGDVWRSRETLGYDAGALFFADSERIGVKKWAVGDLAFPGDFFYDRESGFLFLRTASGEKPADLEASLTRPIVNYTGRSYVLFEDLHLTKGAAHGFGGSNTHHIVIRDCHFSYIGGGYLFDDWEGKPVRYGNGVEFWGNARNNLVENCRFWEIYDTAMTNQYNGKRAVQENIYYLNNEIRNCGLASFEFWNHSSLGRMGNIVVKGNRSENPGTGWGARQRPDGNSFHISSFGNKARTEGIYLMDNIFLSSELPSHPKTVEWNHLFIYDEDYKDDRVKFIIRDNIWSMPSPLWIERDMVKDDFSGYSSRDEWAAESPRVHPGGESNDG